MDEIWKLGAIEGIHLDGNNIVWTINGRRVCRPATEPEKLLIAQLNKELLRDVSISTEDSDLHVSE